MLVDETNFGLLLYNHANFYRFEETSSYWSVTRRSVFLYVSLVNQRHTSAITVHNRTVSNIENTVRAVHSCNSWFILIFNLELLYLIQHLEDNSKILEVVGLTYNKNFKEKVKNSI